MNKLLLRFAGTGLLAILFAVFAYAATAEAASVNVSGKVTDASTSSPIPNVTVQFDDSLTSTIVATTSTDATGNYSASVPTGLYDIAFTPTSGGYTPTILSAQSITQDTVINLTLVPPPPPTYTVSGAITQSDGSAASGDTVKLTCNGTNLPTVTSQQDGSYSVPNVTGGQSCQIQINGTNLGSTFEYYNSQPVTVNQNITINYNTPPLVTTTVHVVGTDGSPISGVTIHDLNGVLSLYTINYDYFDSHGNAVGDAFSYLPAATTNSNGDAQVSGFQGSQENVVLAATPPANDGYVQTSIPGFIVTSGGTVDVTLNAPPPTYSVSGVITQGDGSPDSGASVRLNCDGTNLPTVTSQQDGSYSVPDVTSGQSCYAFINGASQGNSFQYSPGQRFTVSSNYTLNFNIPPLVATTVHIIGTDGNPVSGVTIQDNGCVICGEYTINADYPTAGAGILTMHPTSPVTNSSGDAQVFGFQGSQYGVNLEATPPANSVYNNTIISGFIVTSGGTINVTLSGPPPTYTVSGVITQSDGTAASGESVKLNCNGINLPTVTSLQDGSYSVPNITGGQNCQIQIKGTNQGNQFEYDNSQPITVNQNTTINYHIPPFVTATVHVIGTDGSPISGVTIQDLNGGPGLYTINYPYFDSNGNNIGDAFSYIPASVTNSNGDAQISGFQGSQEDVLLTAVPPAGDGYVQTPIPGFIVTSGGVEVVHFIPSVPTAPVLSAASIATNAQPVLSWTAPLGANSYEVFRDGAVIGNTNALTFTDGSILSDGNYAYTVQATGAGGNSPDSNQVTVVVDKTNPSISYSLSPTPNSSSWNNGTVTVTFNCSDTVTSGASSGIANCSGPVSLSVEGANQQVSGSATDNAGNTATITATVNIDKTSPSISASSSTPSGSYAGGWTNQTVTVHFTCSDALSGVAICPADQVVSTDTVAAGVNVTGTATDNAGNTATSSPLNVMIDKTAPTVGTIVWGSNPKAVTSTTTLSAPAGDLLSGIAGGEYFVGATDPGVGNGTAMTYASGSISATIGSNLATGLYTFSVRSKDNAGNWSNVTTDTLIVYDPSGPGMTGKSHALVPSLANGDTLPGLISSTQTDPASYAFTAGYNNSGGFDNNSKLVFDYSTGTNCNKPTATNCHTFHVDTLVLQWLVINSYNGAQNAHGLFQGTATVTIDGGTPSTNPIRVDGIDGDLVGGATQDHFLLTIYAPGADPSTATAIYQASGDVGLGNGIKIR